MQPNHMLKGFALNNLALASWWHKLPATPEEALLIKVAFVDNPSTNLRRTR